MNNTVLAVVVEDDPFLAEIYSDTLRGIGMRVETFHDGESAIQEISPLKPNLIILDLHLPKRSGIEIFRHLRKQTETAETWVLIVTATPTQAAELTHAEVDSENLLILSKPLSVEQLDQLAHRLVFRN
ncbi:MAG: response regulator [Anaerolineales bacterium]|jgi:two-component system response regulator AdeR|nr:response regulator [Anaerolineales bacterium]